MSPLTPEERAYHDALADAAEMGYHGEDALRYADHMRNTVWFGLRTARHAIADERVALADTLLARIIRRLLALVGREWRP